jgi:predicted nucleic acid-binding protein
MRLLLDTTVLVDVFCHRKNRREFLGQALLAGHKLTTTTLNIGEIYAGIRPGEEVKTEVILQNLESFDITGTIARLGGKLKNDWANKGRTLALVDAIVAAAAIEPGCTLVTDNRKHFPMPELSLYPLP